MLSRIAEAMFWIGRYVERAEATTRLLIEHHQLIVQDTRIDPDPGARAMLDPLGLESEAELTAISLVRLVVGNAENPTTILGSVAAARENARTIRDVLPADMFERLNSTFNWLSGGISTLTPGVPLRSLLDELAVVTGIIDWQMPRDEGLVFLRLGANLERLDMTSRLLEIDHEGLWPQAGAATTLRAVGALNPFLHTQRSMTGQQVAGFLVLDPGFPRSMLHCAQRSEDAVRTLAAPNPGQTAALLRTVGILRAELEFASTTASYTDLQLLSSRARDAAFQASDAVAQAFFRAAGTIVWSH
ncbi:MAG: alpha-E domain-containing protein [Candidatus Nanopelagicales bacterium]